MDCDDAVYRRREKSHQTHQSHAQGKDGGIRSRVAAHFATLAVVTCIKIVQTEETRACDNSEHIIALPTA